MFKNLFNRNKAQKQPEPQEGLLKATATIGNEPGKGNTVLRSAEPMDTLDKNKSLLKLAEDGGWKVNNVPEYNIGDIIDDTYKIVNKFSGGMGFVYITEPTGQGIQFAIKQSNRIMLENKSFFARMIREADTWNGLGIHPNIAYCYFVKLVDGIPCIFIEYVDGGNLREWITEGQCLDIRTSLDMAIQFCHGLEHAHKKGVIHRDIKPENVLMTKDGGVKITDFGLAGALEGIAGKVSDRKGGQLTQFGDVMGTEAYMAPEQWEGPHNVDERADIFSFGVCMWEMFCGKRPYKIAYGDDIEPPTSAQTLRPELTASHVELLYKCIDLDKAKRYKGFTELREALNSIYRELYKEDSFFYTIKLPDSLADELNNRGYSYYQLGNMVKAYQCWGKSLQIDPKHLVATYNLNFLKWNRGEITGGELLRKLELTETRSPEYWLCVGWIYYLQGNHEAAKRIQESENKITDSQFLKALENTHSPMGRLVREFGGHTSSVTSVCFSPDGKFILSGSGDKTICLWEAATGKEIRRFEGHTNKVNSICFSPDGKFVLSGSHDLTIRLWETATGIEIRKFKGHTSSLVQEGMDIDTFGEDVNQIINSVINPVVNSVCFSPDAKFILSGSCDDTIRLWEAITGEEIRKFEGQTREITSVCFSPDGKFILSGSGDRTIRLWEAATGKEIKRFIGHASSVTSVCFSPDGKFILSGSGEMIGGNHDKTIRLWEVSSGKETRKFEGHASTVTSVCFSQDRRLVLSGSQDGTIRLWEAATGKEIRKFEGNIYSVYSVCFSPDGKFFLSGSGDKTIRLWEFSYPVNNKISKLSFPILTLIRTSEQIIKLQKKANLLFIDARLAKESGNYGSAIAILRQIQELRGYGQNPGILDFITICRQGGKGIPTGLKNYWIRKKFEGHTDWIRLVCFSPDGRHILSVSNDETIRLWEAATGKEVRKFEGHTQSVKSVCYSPDGRFVLSAGGKYDPIQFKTINCTIRLWKTATGEEIRKFEGHTSTVTSVSFSPDGRYVLSGSADKTIRLWEAATGKEIRKLIGHSGSVDSVCFSPDGRFVLSRSQDQTISLWEAATGKEIRKFEGHTWAWDVIFVCFSPDGKFILSGSGDKTICLWEATTGREIRRFEGHTDKINSVCFSPDGRYILSGSKDKTIRLWESATGKELRRFEGHTDGITSVCFSPDGRYILSGGTDNKIILSELDWEWEFPNKRT